MGNCKLFLLKKEKIRFVIVFSSQKGLIDAIKRKTSIVYQLESPNIGATNKHTIKLMNRLGVIGSKMGRYHT